MDSNEKILNLENEIRETNCKFREELHFKEEEIKSLKGRLEILETKWSVVEMFLKK